MAELSYAPRFCFNSSLKRLTFNYRLLALDKQAFVGYSARDINSIHSFIHRSAGF